MNGRNGFRIFLAVGMSGLLLLLPAEGEQRRFDTAGQWRQWQLPGAIALDAGGTIRPVRITKEGDAVTNAAAFGGGIRDVGSNSGQARFVMDGDPTTGWSPDPADDPEDWYLEIDLGRAVAAQQVTLVFDEEAPPFALFNLFLSTGEPAIDVVANIIEGSLIYRFQERFKENEKHRVSLELDPVRYPFVRFLRVESLMHVPGARLVEVEVEEIGDNIALGLLGKGGDLEIILDIDGFGDEIPLGNARAIIDGDFSMWLQHRRINRSVNVISHITLDLGAVYWVDLVRIVADFLSAPGQFRFNYDTYQVLTSDGSLAPDGTRIWREQFSGKATEMNRRLGIANHYFPALQTRYVRIAWVFWDAACAAACVDCGIVPPCQFWGETRELQIFGEGYPSRVSMHSPLIDLGSRKHVNGVRWGGDLPADTRVEVRSRTGDELVYEITYFDKNGKEVTEKQWNKLIPSFRGPVDTTSVPGGDWSPWSDAYLESGELFRSPSPRRYMELEVALISAAPDRAASLDYLEVEYGDPLAEDVAAELSPTLVTPGELTEFSYFVRAARTPGFDQLKVAASVPMRFTQAYIEGQPVEVEAEKTDEGFRLTFPAQIGPEELVELRFEAAVFAQATRFRLFLADGGGEVLQAVEPGDVVPQAEGNTNVVQLPVEEDLLAHVVFSTPVLTPNGDGINDALAISLDLVNVLEARPLTVSIFDLAGRPLRVVEREARAGAQVLVWDGTDGAGERVLPGLYLLELRIEGDAREERAQRAIAVAY